MVDTFDMSIISRLAAIVVLVAALLAIQQVHGQHWQDSSNLKFKLEKKPEKPGEAARKLTNLPAPVNTRYNEFSPSLTADGNTMVFNSNRYGKYQNIYITNKKDGLWSHPVMIPGINSKYNDETPFISADGSMLVFASDRDGSLEMPKNSRGQIKVSFDLYWSSKKNGKWQRPRKVPHVNSAQHERAPSISNDGRYIFFARWPFGQLLKTRIMVGELAGQGVKNIQELPAAVNSNFAEAAFVPAQGRKGFYFSAARKDSQGGWDIYFIGFDNGKFGKTERLEGAINSKGNDLYLSSTRDNIYFCSNRKGGLGGYDIYSYQVEKRQIIMVKVVNKKTGQPIQSTARFTTSKESFGQASDSNGTIELSLGENDKLNAINVSQQGFRPYRNNDVKIQAGRVLVQLVPQEKKIEKDFMVHAHDEATGAPLKVTATYQVGKKQYNVQSDNDGKLRIRLKGNEQIDRLTLKKNGYEVYRSEHPRFEKGTHTALLKSKKGDRQYIVTLKNKKTGAPVVGSVTYSVDGKEQKWQTDSSGRVGLKVKQGQKVTELSVIKPGFLPYHRIDPRFLGDGHVALLEPIEKEKSFTLHNIHFDFNSARLKKRSTVYLKALADFIKANHELRFRIIGHTDLNGSKSYNEKLSLERAAAVKEFLVKSGIKENRFEVAGAGFSRPVVRAKNPKADALNRRTEFKILSN